MAHYERRESAVAARRRVSVCARGLVRGEESVSRLKACPASPNCVSSMAADEKHRIEPFPYTGFSADALARVKAVALSFPRTKLAEEQPGYARITFTSAVLRFVDDVELEVNEASKVVDVRSASRVGYADFGVNRKRVEAIRTKLGFQRAR
jgi:uncharacterized protein (DUF1499 family)